MRRAVFSIGTNSTRALVAQFGGERPEIVYAASIGTRIGEGLRERGRLTEDAMARTIDALIEHRRNAAAFVEDGVLIATSALRRADNAAEFAHRVERATSLRLTVLDGAEEAAASFAGAVAMVRDAPRGTRFGVADPGGGSTEYATGTADVVESVRSVEIGAVRVTEQFPELAGDRGPVPAEVTARAAAYAASMLGALAEAPRVDHLMLVGGSASSAVGMLRRSRESFVCAEVSAEDLHRLTDRIAGTPLDGRRHTPGLNPQRADIILGGLLILRGILAATGFERATVSTADLLLGYLLRHGS